MTNKPSPTAVGNGYRRAAAATRAPSGTLPGRYHPALVALHWILALLLALALGMGTFVLAQTPNGAVGKIDALRGHMIMGITIGALMLVRLIVRLRRAVRQRPRPGMLRGPVGQSCAHRLYVLVFAMAASGGATALLSGLPDLVFGNTMAPLPESFFAYPPRIVHGWVAKALFLLIGLHVIGALFHQFARKDRLLARMWFGNRSEPRS